MNRWGCFAIQVLGRRKWTTLCASTSLYYGAGYPQTRKQAQRLADAELAHQKRMRPGRVLRIVEARTYA